MPDTTLNRMPCLLAGAGDPEDMHVITGGSSHFIRAGLAAGLFDGVVPTRTGDRTYRVRRATWTLRRLLTTGTRGGFLVSERGINTVWRNVTITSPCRIVNFFQLYPLRVVNDLKVMRWYFIDQTLTQLFEGYDYRMASETAQHARALEQRGYGGAEGLIVPSRWAKDSLIHDYAIASEKIHIVPQAANIDPSLLEKWAEDTESRVPPPERPLRLVFVGRDWRRKGLDRLLRGFEQARRKGGAVELSIVGTNATEVPEDLATVEGVRWHGLIDKTQDERTFIEVVGSHDVGCLLSRSEAGGYGLHEYHAVGLAVLGTTAGGAPEQVLSQASLLLPSTASADAIADSILMLDRDRDRVSEMKAYSWAHRREVLWPERIERIFGFWPDAYERG